jgi:hypothetical protein
VTPAPSQLPAPEPAGAIALPRWALWAAGLLLVVQIACFHGVRRDDAFISFRYAQNLSEGRGLVFNPGERLMGSTSPGHVLLAALAHRAVGDELLPSVMSALGCVGWTAQALAILVLLARALPLPAAALIALAVGLGAGRAQEHVSLETTIVAGLLCWALVTALNRRWLWTAALGALAGLFRPDMYLPVALLGAICVWQTRARALRPALLFAALTLPWYLFAASYFGKVLPQSAATKYQRSPLADYALFQLKQNGVGLPFAPPIAVNVIACLLSVAGAVVLVRRDRRLWPLPAVVVLHVAAYLWLRPFTHLWHLYPVAMLSAVLMLVALAAAAERLSLGRAPLARTAALLPVGMLVLAYGYAAARFALDHELGPWHGSRDSVYRTTAAYLKRHARPTDLVASVEVGTIAYYTDLRMWDWGALITPNAVFRPTEPRLNWAVVDHNFAELGAGLAPVKTLKAGPFTAKVYNFDLMEAAAHRMMATQGRFRLKRLQGELRPQFEREVQAMGRSLEQSGLRIDAFLARGGH